MQTIEFKRTSNVFLNTGIIALEYYLDRYKEEQSLSDDELYFELQAHKLIVNSPKLLEILEEVYYLMGREVYDTVTSEQINNAQNSIKCNLFYDNVKDKFFPFPKIKSYGLPLLLTNGRPKNTIHESNQSTIAKLRESDPVLASKFEETFTEKKLDIGSVIYFNEPYTTIPRLVKFDDKYLQATEKAMPCFLTGEKFDKLIDIGNNLAFASLQGDKSFNSLAKPRDLQISWKSMVLMRFSPKYCYYHYLSLKYEQLVCYFFYSNDFLALKKYYRIYGSIFKSFQKLQADLYISNFDLYQFGSPKKDDDTIIKDDFIERHEKLFMLIYSIYKKILFNRQGSDSDVLNELFDFIEKENDSIQIVTFQSDKFSGTFRPNSFETFNQFKFIVKLIAYSEKNGLDFNQFLRSLKFQKTQYSSRDFGEKIRLERQLRNEVLNKVLKQKSVISEIETLFYDCFMYLNSNENVGYKDYKMLVKFLEIYEPIINQNMDKEQFQTLQNRAINLGKSIGMSILTFDEGNKQANAKDARSYIIGLHKARTAEQFREAIIRIQTKYGLVMSGELLQGLNEETFEFIKQYAVISALNIINSIIKPQNEPKNEN